MDSCGDEHSVLCLNWVEAFLSGRYIEELILCDEHSISYFIELAVFCIAVLK